jgi:hypothetical protein
VRYFAHITDNDLVDDVVVVEESIDVTSLLSSIHTGEWIEAFNGYGNKMFDEITGETLDEPCPRYNRPGAGYSYLRDADAFVPPSPFESWILDTSTYIWKPPIPMPEDGNEYSWNEKLQTWVLEQDISEPNYEVE